MDHYHKIVTCTGADTKKTLVLKGAEMSCNWTGNEITVELGTVMLLDL
jgi:hypothetical protein